MSRNARQTESRQQVDRFIEVARDAGCDEDESAFEDALGRVAKAKSKMPGKAKATKQKTPE